MCILPIGASMSLGISDEELAAVQFADLDGTRALATARAGSDGSKVEENSDCTQAALPRMKHDASLKVSAVYTASSHEKLAEMILAASVKSSIRRFRAPAVTFTHL